MSIGLDYTSRIPPDVLKAADVSVVCRYIAPQSWKVITKSEYEELKRAGITIYLNWESAANDWADGAAGGTADGTRAVNMAKALGYPAGSIIIGSADYDAKNMSVVREYASAFQAALAKGGYRAGVYGPYYVLTECQKLGYSFYWQTMSTSFSDGKNRNLHPATNLWQKGYKTVAGHQCDWSRIINLPSAGGQVGQAEEPDVNLTDTVHLPNWDNDPNFQEQDLTVAVALAVSAERSYQALRAAQGLKTDVDALKALVQGLNAPAQPDVDYDLLADKVAERLGKLVFKVEDTTP